MEEEVIDLRDLFFKIVSKWKLIASLTVVFAIVGAIISFLVLAPVYQANTKLIVKSEKTMEQISVAQKLAKNYGEIVKSEAVLNGVIKNLNLDMSYPALLGNVSVSNIQDTQIIDIYVNGNNRKQVAKIANEIPKLLVKNVAKIENANNIEVIDRANTPTSPIKPNKKKTIVVAAFLGMTLGIGIVVIQELFNTKLKKTQEAESGLGLPLLGVIPLEEKNQEADIIAYLDDEKSSLSEQYRVVRTNVEFLSLDEKLKVICLTSATENEGKSTIISNLAVAIEKLDKKVLLIDANLRNPSIDKKFNINTVVGLTDILNENRQLEQCVTKLGNLDVLIAGSMVSNPSDILLSKRMRDLIKNMREQYDYVFIDTPPVGDITDACIMSKYADGVIFVVAQGIVAIDEAKIAVDKLKVIDANILGIVFNKFKSNQISFMNYYNNCKDFCKNKCRKNKKK